MRFVREIFTDTNGSFSSKRTVTLIAFLLLMVAFLSNLFWGLQIEQFIFDAMTYIVLGGLGFATAEPLANAFFHRPSKSALAVTALDEPMLSQGPADADPK